MDEIPNVRELSDEAVIAFLDKRVEFGSINDAETIDFIREVMFRKLWPKFSASSMYDFLTRARYTFIPSAAQKRLDAACLMDSFPEIKSMLATGDLQLTQLGMLAKALRKKPVGVDAQRVNSTQIILAEALGLEVKTQSKIKVQRDGSVRVKMTFSKEEWEILTRTKEVVSHSVPSGELTEVLIHCAKFTLSKKDPAAQTDSTSPGRSSGVSNKDVSRASRRFVFTRDKSCRHRHPDGQVCGSRYQLPYY
jgi:hypothetical protein